MKAVRSWDDYAKSSDSRTMGVVTEFSRKNPPRSPSDKEITATVAALNALAKSIEYYHHNGKILDAYTQVRKVAEIHWHPVVDTLWDHHFIGRARDLGIPIPRELEEAMEESAQRNFRRLMLDEHDHD